MKENTLFESILNAPNFSAIIAFIAVDICKFLSAERVTIFQKGRHDNEIVSRFKTGSTCSEIRVSLGTSSIAGYVALSQQPLYFKDVYLQEDLQKAHPNLRFDSSFDLQSGFQTRSMLTLPIKGNNVFLGVFQVINKLGGGAFTSTDAKRALQLAEVIGKKFSKDLNATQSPYDYLVTQKLITLTQLKDIELRAIKNKIHPSELMINELHIDPLSIGASLENFYQVPYQPYDESIKPPLELLHKVSIGYIRKHLCVPISGNTQQACIVIDDPSDYRRILEVQQALGIENVIVRICLPVDILRFIGTGTSILGADLRAIVGELKEDAEAIDDDLYSSTNAPLSAAAAPIIKLVNKIIFDAVYKGASDIHIEPGKENSPTVIRMRFDGLCREIERIPAQYAQPLLSRIKIISRLDIAEHRKPQDGKCKLKFGGKLVELRVAIIPTVNGESAVIRVLSNAGALPIDKLNLSQRNTEHITQLISQPHGIFLVVGPTGSGKTTTLHGLLGYLNTPDKKIWTAEDPVEITQPGLQQVQVMPKIGFDFAAAMRSFLRADPDIILIGEIRDRETAHIAIEASLTGHLVLSTLHTNSAAESIVRLLDLGLDPLNFADALLGILAQRLMRTLCKQCKIAYHPDDTELEKTQRAYGKVRFDEAALMHIKHRLLKTHGDERFNSLDIESSKLILFKANGCPLCDHTGYKGRTGIHELLAATPNIKAIVSKGATVTEIRTLAIKEGMRTLAQDGVLKILEGLSDLYQLHRVVAEE
ncbi:MAG: GspE/PulE family protein [Methylococcales bacterium]|nr:GspE/PulE family protein [Methylococcales bacterium]